MQRLAIHIRGIVQGVGFRPFVYNLAHRYHLGGWVLNNSAGVEIEIEGCSREAALFLHDVKTMIPPLAIIEEMKVAPCKPIGETEFIIKYSTGQAAKTAWISPDVAACKDCQREIHDPMNRRYGYAFTNCTNCGPRYSIIKDVPYDRGATTMDSFPMCADCQAEYSDPLNRRFHAQPNACPKCGPRYRLMNSAGEIIDGDEFKKIREIIALGHIAAIKGIGGYHLACDGKNEQAVARLRSRKVREDKPFAVMCGSMKMIHQLCEVSAEEEELLTGAAGPIVLLAKKNGCDLAKSIAPGNGYLGVMLPYTPAHWLLLSPEDVWVMTSGNVSDEPIIYRNKEALKRLAGIADYFLIHNREIFQPCEDSIICIVKEKQQILRRSRGFSPSPIKISRGITPILAVGSEVKNAFCLTRGSFVFMSGHMGDLENFAAYQAYIAAINHYKKIFSIEPAAVGYDLHPEYLATKYALSLELPQVGVQHHHAHIASVLAEYNLNEKVIGVAFDGTGYGSDGTLWGGEFLLADCREFTRAGHCKYLPLPGGVKAIKEPWRITAWVLYNLYGNEFTRLDMALVHKLPQGWQLLLDAAGKGINSPLTSSAGRLFDIAAGILGIRSTVHYEGQAAIELELAVQKELGQVLPYTISGTSPYVLDFMPAFAALAEGMKQGSNIHFLSACFHVTVAQATVDMVCRIRQDTGLGKVALSGGVWQNRTLLKRVVGMLQQENMIVYINQRVPPNDGGIAFGQAAVAGMRIMER